MIHPTAIVHEDAQIAAGVEIGPFAVIGVSQRKRYQFSQKGGAATARSDGEIGSQRHRLADIGIFQIIDPAGL